MYINCIVSIRTLHNISLYLPDPKRSLTDYNCIGVAQAWWVTDILLAERPKVKPL